ncbi:TetR/AcrR family transcriptional regulator [Devosia epidermidihirudinis]|uniref:TetR/AcrR family transcriptional regulator n=1 Tax=Devosia epidermidihirudinis TaxID=1293439 RepID=UPI0018D24365|nr:TetR/AcrR family transcriptional regulator [Devosia epidermidihirudinis]
MDTLETQRRRHIIDCTINVLVRDGVAGTSLSRVAREAKVAKGIICYYFKSKDGLYDAVLTSVRERTVAAAIAKIERLEDAWERISAFVAAYVAHVRDHRAEILALRHLASTKAGGSAASDHLSVWREQQAWLADALAEGQETGAFKEFDVDIVANAMSGAIESGLLQWAHDPETDLEHRADQLLALFEPGVRDTQFDPVRQNPHLEGNTQSGTDHGTP